MRDMGGEGERAKKEKKERRKGRKRGEREKGRKERRQAGSNKMKAKSYTIRGILLKTSNNSRLIFSWVLIYSTYYRPEIISINIHYRIFLYLNALLNHCIYL